MGNSGFVSPGAYLILALAVTVSSPGCGWRWSSTLPVLTSVAEIRQLAPEEADRHYPVRLRAVTLYHDSLPNVLLIQDSSGGIRVELRDTHAQFSQGDVLLLRGVTSRGQFFPMVRNATAEAAGKASLPPPVRLIAADLELPERQDQYCEIHCIIRGWAERHDGRVGLRVDSGGANFDAILLDRNGAVPDKLVGAAATIRGVPATLYSLSGAVLGRQLLIAGGWDIRVESSPAARPQPPPSQRTGPPLVWAAQVRALRSVSRKVPVRLRGVVSFYDPDFHILFFQDPTAGIFVFTPGFAPVRQGDSAELEGVADLGGFAPAISEASFHVLGRARLPDPPILSLVELFSGRFDSQRVAAEGVVQSVARHYHQPHIEMDVAAGRYRFVVHVPYPLSLPLPTHLIDAAVRIRGVAGSVFNPMGQLAGVILYAPDLKDIQVLLPGRPAAASPIRPISGLLHFSLENEWEHRVRVRGTVEYQRARSREVFVADETGGVLVRTEQEERFQPGDRVEAVGFAVSGAYSPVLGSAELRKLGPGKAPLGVPVDAQQALGGEFDGRLITTEGYLVNRVIDAAQQTLTLESGNILFNATMERDGAADPLTRLREGALLRLSGICSVERGEHDALPRAFQLLLRGPADVRVLRQASWLTRERTTAVAGWMGGIAAMSAIWIWILRRRVRQQTAVIRSKLENEAALKLAAQAASRTKSEFLANMSHEIRTPLNGILGFAGLMAESELTGPQREHNEAVRSSAESLLAVINDILDFSRVEAGRVELESVDFSICKCVATAVAAVQPLLAEKGLATSVQIADDVPDWVIGDPHRLRQVLLNLLGNAVKFTVAGGVAVRVSLAPEQEAAAARSDVAPAPRQIQFAVSDTGVGIPESQRELIFQPFQQADGSVTRRFGGTGLGLAISRKLVTMMGGRIWLESVEGKGSTLFFTAPLPPGKAPAENEKPSVAAGVPLPPPQPPSQPLSILVAEDNVVNQLLMRTLLEKRGHRVTMVADGVTALAAWRQDRFDCILMDIQMPEMDGYEATRRIRAQESGNGAHIPIIALTAHALKGDREKCLQAGLDSYISKPIETGALDAALANLPARN